MFAIAMAPVQAEDKPGFRDFFLALPQAGCIKCGRSRGLWAGRTYI